MGGDSPAAGAGGARRDGAMSIYIAKYTAFSRDWAVDVTWTDDNSDMHRLASLERPDPDLPRAVAAVTEALERFIGVELSGLKVIAFPATQHGGDVAIRATCYLAAGNGMQCQLTTDKIEYQERTNRQTMETYIAGVSGAPLELYDAVQGLQRELVLYIGGKRAQKELAFEVPTGSAQ